MYNFKKKEEENKGMWKEKVIKALIRAKVNFRKFFRRLSVRPVFSIVLIFFVVMIIMVNLDIPFHLIEEEQESKIENEGPEGYSFEGWYVDRHHNIPYEGDLENIKELLYAKWKPKLFNISLDKNGGSGGEDEIEIYMDGFLPNIEKPQKEGYVFAGYFEKPNGQGEMYYNENMQSHTQWKKAKDTTIYAYWYGPLTIPLDKTGGQGGDDFIEVIYTKELPDIEPPQKQGYIFQGYFSETQGKGRAYYDGQTRKLSEWDTFQEQTLYAHWKSLEDIYHKDQNFIYLGEYPQSLATSQAVAEMRSQTEEDGNYYISEYDNQKYIKIQAEPFRSSYKYSSGEQIIKGQEYYFKIEPLKWRIIKEENNYSQLISDRIIDSKYFSFIDNSWEFSHVREMLNNSFYNSMFTIEEKSIILPAQNQTKYLYSETTYQTTDNLYLIREQDILNVEDSQRAALVTDYALATGAWMSQNQEYYGYGFYLLRSSGYDNKSVSGVYRDGKIFSNYLITYQESGIRPAITLRTE